MGSVHRLEKPSEPGFELGAAVEEFLAGLANRNTARAYGSVLRSLVGELGADTSVGALDDEAMVTQVAAWFRANWGNAAAATVNARLDALRSAGAWWRDQGWITGNPARRIHRRARTPDRTLALSRAETEGLLDDKSLPLRERTLWRLLYETAARAGEALSLDVVDLDLRNRRAKVRRKGGAADMIVWRTGTARLLPRLLEGYQRDTAERGHSAMLRELRIVPSRVKP